MNNPMLRGEGGSGVRQEEVEAPKKKYERFEFKNFANCHPPEFHGKVDPIVSQRWIDEIEETFMLCECPEHLKEIYAAHQMKGSCYEWWNFIVKSHGRNVATSFPWEKFREMFMDQFAPPAKVSRLKSEFMNIEHGSKSVTEFNADPKLMMDHYHEKLNPKISEFIDKGTYKTLAEMMNRALVREHELKKKAAFKRKLDQDSKSMQSMSPKKGNFNSESPHKSKGGFMPGKGGGKEVKTCNRCGKNHTDECKAGTTDCYSCGKPGHRAAESECLKYKKDLASGGVKKEVKTEPKKSDSRPRARAHQITVLEAKESQNVVSEHPLEVDIANNKTIMVYSVIKGCEIILDDEKFVIDLIPMHIGEFQVIVGMDWLDDNEGIIAGRKKIVLVQAPSGKVIWIYGERARRAIPICTYARAKRFLSHGCCAFLAHVIDDSKKVFEINNVPVVNEFPDVFSDELPGVPPDREVEFRIELIPGATPIAKAPYRLAPGRGAYSAFMTSVRNFKERKVVRQVL
ncbi:uncharacterized protein [Rutidosis leptorrhynchoides]|uniref:uncharacterized protein n=1 Tax=Rutidosis leptorrhynchoides TaxID=125765 RepID=UPI003A9971E2